MTRIKGMNTDLIRIDQFRSVSSAFLSLLVHHFHPSSVYTGGDAVIVHRFAIRAG